MGRGLPGARREGGCLGRRPTEEAGWEAGVFKGSDSGRVWGTYLVKGGVRGRVGSWGEWGNLDFQGSGRRQEGSSKTRLMCTEIALVPGWRERRESGRGQVWEVRPQVTQ